MPESSRLRSHQRLLEQMLAEVRARFSQAPVAWDPGRADDARAPDLGRGLLDSHALALHVLWVYRQAWAAEGFLSTARLDASVHRLLGQLGYAPRPAMAADGLQHFRLRAGMKTTLPPGFKVGAAAQGDLPGATYETLSAVRLNAALNELKPFLPTQLVTIETAGAIAADADPALFKPEVRAPLPGSAPGDGDIVRSLRDRLEAARAGDLAARNAVRARQEALQLAELADQLQQDAPGGACAAQVEQICDALCAAQALAAQVAEEPQPGPLSESQELLTGQLLALAGRQPEALSMFEEAMARQDGESRETFSRRLDQMAGFLDILVTGLLQEGRDNLVRLKGARVLTQFDRDYGDPEGTLALGVAPPGTDSLFLLPRVEDIERGPETHLDLLRPGDWLVIGEDIVRTGPDGEQLTERRWRESVQLVRVRDEVPEGRREPMTRISFRPPLQKRYQLARTVLLGNMARIGHGVSVEEPGGAGAGGNAASRNAARQTLSQSPLTWVHDPRGAEGRSPQITLEVAGRLWRRVDALCGQEATEGIFAIEPGPDGQAGLRFGNAEEGAALPDPGEIRVRYRVGGGAGGNRAAGAVADLADADPAVSETFNPLPVSGGSDVETAAEVRARAGSSIHGLDRVVSIDDLRSLALTHGGVRCVRVFRDPVRRREQLTVVVCGDNGEALDSAELGLLHGFLVARVPPGVSLRIGNPVLVPVRARMRLLIAAGADPLDLSRDVRLALGLDHADDGEPGLLAPTRTQLGRDLELSDLYRALAAIPDLVSTHVELLHRGDAKPGRSERVVIADSEMAVWDMTTEALELGWTEEQAR